MKIHYNESVSNYSNKFHLEELMSVLIDKLILLISCFIFYLINTKDIAGIFYFLGAISITCLISYFDTKKASALLIIAFVIISLIFPGFCFYLPLVAYDLFLYRHRVLSFAALFAFINFTMSNTLIIALVILSICGISLWLQYKSERLKQLQFDFKKLRDTSTEYNLLLRSKNKDLIEKQDYEIHLATLRERNRIAREIHDNVGHVLSRSLLQLGAIMAINKDEKQTPALSALKDTLSTAMNSIRESVHGLHDESIDLHATVQGLIKDFDNYELDFDFDMSTEIPKNIKYCLVAITKEALSNISKHSNATSISMHYREHPGFYQLLIEDNGTNITVNSSGIGLENMEDRVTGLNGTFRTNIENGFRIFVSIPKTKLTD